MDIIRIKNLVLDSGIFDEEWYVNAYPDCKGSTLSPLDHFLKYGLALKRNPSSKFDTIYYFKANPDIARAGMNPLVHYIEHGLEEGRPSLPQPALPPVTIEQTGERVDIVIPVYNALEDVKNCFASVNEKTDGYIVNVFVVNDGSNEETTHWLKGYCKQDNIFQLIEHEKNKGYTPAVNTGLRASTAPYVITLNSDTIVTRGWLKGLVRCINSASAIGIVGPLSNAASWQNVPNLYDETGGFAVNQLEDGITPDDMAGIVAAASDRSYPRLPFVNGFCFMIKREVINKVGIMDEENFPIGYGEENDFCIRAADAGYALAIADDTYVFHAKSKSFGHESRKTLSKHGSDAIKRKHTASKFSALVELVKKTEPLDIVRSAVKKHIESAQSGFIPTYVDVMSMKILFLLPVKGGSGGAHSVVQEVAEMRHTGIEANIAVRSKDLPALLDMYHDIDGVTELFIGFTPRDIVALSDGYDVVVGTIFNSMGLVRDIVDAHPHILPAYYAQDYEPLFFVAESENWHLARESYALVPNALVFAKTCWIGNIIQKNHNVIVHKVSPSIDHKIYRLAKKAQDEKIHVAAMIRPQTPRRGAERTMRLLSRVARSHYNATVFHLFGCAKDDPLFLALQRDFEYENRGVLKRAEVANLLAKSDIFIDLSDYQAFGRTSLEAMACGCAGMLPVHGGTDEYAIDNINSLVVDSFDEEDCFNRLTELILNKEKLAVMKREALSTASKYSVHAAAISELCLFSEKLNVHRAINPKPIKSKLYLMPERDIDNVVTRSGYNRLVLPYGSLEIRKKWEVIECDGSKLPSPCAGDRVIMQRYVRGHSLDELKEWLTDWRAKGGYLIYDMDCDLISPKKMKSGNDTSISIEKARWLASSADIVTITNSTLAEKVMTVGTKVKIIPDFIDAELWQLGKERLSGVGNYERQAGDPIRIGFIGAPSEAQDLGIVAEAMRRIEGKYKDRVQIEIIGGFQEASVLFGQRVGLPKARDFLNLVDWLQRRVHWDIGIIPVSESTISDSAMKFFEYSSLGLASVCSRASGVADIFENDECALFVENNTADWFTAIENLIINKDKRRSLIDKSSAMIDEHFTVTKNTESYFEILDFH